MTEYEKMLSGEIYNAVDPSLLKDLYACSELCWEYNRKNEMCRVGKRNAMVLVENEM